MKWATAEFTVKTGEQVKLQLKNVATLAAMVHNVVILKQGADIQKIGTDAIAAGEAKGYIPESDMILASSPLAKPGETVELTFTAPAAGEYTFICTYPGHYVLMQGTMKVI